MALDLDIKKRWVAGLRSGDYKQGVGVLCEVAPQGNRFCCFGVLCDILKLTYLEHHRGDDFGGGGRVVRYYNFNPDRGAVVPGNQITKDIGPHNVDHLMTMNDTHESFDEIADYIEDHL